MRNKKRQEEVPFAIGQEVEYRSKENGFRGAWFRCRIKEFFIKDGSAHFRVDYLDYEDSVYEHKLYETYPGRLGTRADWLMVRPKFPEIVAVADLTRKPYPFVTINRDYQPGDQVEWLWEDTHWTCKILRVLSDSEVRVKVPDPPFGEGRTYTVEKILLRPALSWSPELGWQPMDPDQEDPLVTVYSTDETSPADSGLEEETTVCKRQKTVVSSDNEDVDAGTCVSSDSLPVPEMVPIENPEVQPTQGDEGQAAVPQVVPPAAGEGVTQAVEEPRVAITSRDVKMLWYRKLVKRGLMYAVTRRGGFPCFYKGRLQRKSALSCSDKGGTMKKKKKKKTVETGMKETINLGGAQHAIREIEELLQEVDFLRDVAQHGLCVSLEDRLTVKWKFVPVSGSDEE